ncbi:MAG: hypothetical protein ACRDGW_10910, partial [Actinomycetota bacterium]
MVGVGTDTAETPDEILRPLADPERLAIAGTLARSEERFKSVRAGRGARLRPRAEGESMATTEERPPAEPRTR